MFGVLCAGFCVSICVLSCVVICSVCVRMVVGDCSDFVLCNVFSLFTDLSYMCYDV